MVEKLEKCQRDLRDYEFFTLSNTIKCIVISDADTEIAAAAMNVHVGSIHDSIPGIAHYLEHMLFMGTSKYPSENAYSTFLSDNAGSSNAFTDNEDTNFFFKVSSDQLRTALDMFSQFFLTPLFDESSLERELKAVDSEFDKNLQDDHWRIQQIISNHSTEPANHFGIGNSTTLKVEGIRDKIIEFYTKYYSANLMSLVIYGQESCEVLRGWAEEMFAGIENKNVQLPVYEVPQFIEKLSLIKVIPVKDCKSLRFLWALPSFIQYYESKPEGYIGHLLGHEGENSLLSYLKHLHLAEELTCMHEDPYTSCSYLSIDVKLTDKGFHHYELVSEIIFAYIHLIQSLQPEEYIFFELKQAAAAEFLFKSKKDPYWFCQKLSSRLVRYPPTKVLTAPEHYYRFDPEMILGMQQLLNFDNLQVLLVSKTFDKSEMREEKYFGTFYQIERLSDQFLERLKNPKLPESGQKLALPRPNPYIPENFEVLELGNEKYPEKVLSSERMVVWHKQDSKYSIDKVYGQLVIYCNSFDFQHSVHFFMLGKLWEKILNEKLREESYLAELGGLKHEVDVDNHGVRISVNGFSQKYQKFFELLVSKVAEFIPSVHDEKMFTDIKNESLNTMSNCFFSKPTTQIQRIAYELNLVGGYFTQMEKIAALVDITLGDVIWFSTKWLKNVFFEWFVIGNISRPSVLSLAQSCLSLFTSQKQPSFFTTDDFLCIKITKMSKKHSEVFHAELADSNNPNSAVLCQFQVGPETVTDECLVYLLESFIEEPCFDTLRTKEQLGYIVSSYSHKMRGILSLMFLVQSSTHCPGHIIDRISQFIQANQEEIEKLTDKQYSKLVKSAIESALKKELSLQEEYQNFKYEVDSAAFQFDRRKKLKQRMREITKEQLLQAHKTFFGENGRRLDICLMAKEAVEKEEKHEKKHQKKLKIYKGVNEFKRKHSAWPQINIRNYRCY